MKKLLYIAIAISTLSICGCAKQKSKENLTFEELKSNTQTALKKKQYNDAADALECIIARFSDRPDIAKYKLALAQAYFKIGRFPSAYELYNHYNQFYPSDKSAEIAKYRAIKSKFYQTLKMDCDQTTTLEASNLCDEYLQNPSYTKYQKDVRDIQHTCQQKLIDKEIYVFNFYLKKGKYQAANNRLKYLEKEYLPKDKDLDARLLYMKCQLAKKEKNQDHLNETLIKLSRDYPESKYSHMAKALITEPTFFF
ncbi:MAG: Outer membrane assembly lipoprotein YfiO [candidate division TM6 bacterium GW2011_GWF2_37_49]|nr:MAG: Outer membrane assembly lipoprotein YfiO [candidate division TM6 bacterium GW2011_GWF2_37_49]